MKTTKLVIILLFASTLLYSCSQEGPVGPTGPTGTTGPVASIEVSTGSIATNGWRDSVSGNLYYTQISDSYITNFTEDEVLAYVQDTVASSNFYALPVSNFPVANASVSYGYRNDTVTFYYQYTTGTTLPPSVPITIKVVVLPYAVIKQHPGLNVHNYTEVMAAVKSITGNK